MRWDFTELRRAAVIATLVTVLGASWSAANAADQIKPSIRATYFSGIAHPNLMRYGETSQVCIDSAGQISYANGAISGAGYLCLENGREGFGP